MKVKMMLVLSLIVAAAAARAGGDIALDSIQVTVVDAGSGEPLADAVVAVTYPVYYEAGRNLHEGPWYEQSGDLFIAETITSASGKAAFRAADVEAPPPGHYVRHDVPLLLVYKAGYQPLLLTEEPRNDNYKGVMPLPERIESSFDDTVVKLEPEPAGGLTEINVNQATGFLEGQFRTTASCRWAQMPQLLDALSAAARTRPVLDKRLEYVTGDKRCLAGPAMRWSDDPGVLELELDVAAFEGGRPLVSPPAPRSGQVTVNVSADGARGILFFETSAEPAQQRELRIKGTRNSLSGIPVARGDRITVHFMNLDPSRVRTGAMELGN